MQKDQNKDTLNMQCPHPLCNHQLEYSYKNEDDNDVYQCPNMNCDVLAILVES